MSFRNEKILFSYFPAISCTYEILFKDQHDMDTCGMQMCENDKDHLYIKKKKKYNETFTRPRDILN